MSIRFKQFLISFINSIPNLLCIEVSVRVFVLREITVRGVRNAILMSYEPRLVIEASDTSCGRGKARRQ